MTTFMILISIITIATIAYAIYEYKPFTPETPEIPETTESPELHEDHNEIKENHIDIPSFDVWCEEHQDITGPVPEGTADFVFVSNGLNAGQFYVHTVIASKEAKRLITDAIAEEKLFFEQHKITLFEEETEDEIATEEATDDTLVGHYLEYFKDDGIPSFEYDPEPDIDFEEEEECEEDNNDEYRYEVYTRVWDDIIKTLGNNMANILSDRVLIQACKNKDIKCLLKVKGIGEKRAKKIIDIIAKNNAECLGDISDPTFIKVESDDLPF